MRIPPFFFGKQKPQKRQRHPESASVMKFAPHASAKN